MDHLQVLIGLLIVGAVATIDVLVRRTGKKARR